MTTQEPKLINRRNFLKTAVVATAATALAAGVMKDIEDLKLLS